MGQRYDIREEPNGTWTVFDLFTDLPVFVNDTVMIGLEVDQADDLVDLLNSLDIQRQDSTWH